MADELILRLAPEYLPEEEILDRIKTLCADAGVKLLYLPPYSPDFNPIEEFFAELKAHIKKAWSVYEDDPGQGFHAFLRRCVYEVGVQRDSAEGHFRY